MLDLAFARGVLNLELDQAVGLVGRCNGERQPVLVDSPFYRDKGGPGCCGCPWWQCLAVIASLITLALPGFIGIRAECQDNIALIIRCRGQFIGVVNNAECAIAVLAVWAPLLLMPGFAEQLRVTITAWRAIGL